MNASAIQKICNSIISHSECTSSSASIAYTYTDDRLTFVSVNDTTEYTLTYDEFGRSLATVAGSAWRGTSTTLSTNAYDDYGKLDRTTYGNGFVVSYVYDSLDRVIAVKFNDTVAYRYTYNGEGDLYSAQDVALGYTIYYEYDHAGRCMASTTKSDSTGAVLASYSYEYDLNNNLSKLTCTTNGTTWATTYAYDGDNRPTATTLSNGKTVTNTYDALGRITRKRLAINSNYDTTYTYLAGANNSQTALLASYQNGSDTAYTYTYDENGNIISISQGGSTTYYTYDRLNELIREDNATLNQSWTYTYDVNGNLLNKKRYAYVPNGGTLGACLETISYGYEAAHQDWADQLTSYNSETIRYDDSGNPISYRGYTMAWQGKRLTSANKSGTTITYSYDENGIRTQKTVNGVSTNYYYNGSVLISQVSGNDTLLFSYDANGSVVSVNFNGTDYYYVRNGQGDVIKLIDGNGATVTEYAYDTWGKLVSCTGSLSATLGTLNPFRYRGYVYDTETGFYYLQSRYYDPEVCRFINADVYLSTGQGTVGYNMYAYCLNNPVNAEDAGGCVPSYSVMETDGGASDDERVGLDEPDELDGDYVDSDGDEGLAISGYSPHKKRGTTNGANRNKHEEGQSRHNRDKNKTEKGDSRRKPRNPKRGANTQKILGGLALVGLVILLMVIIGDDATGIGAVDDAAIPAVISLIVTTAASL